MPWSQWHRWWTHALLRTAAAVPLLTACAEPADAGCRAIEANANRYTACTFDTRTAAIELFLDDSDGRKLEHFGRVRELVEARGGRLAFAMNAGMYEEDRRPVGHLRIQGREIRRLNTRNAGGNFYLKPNGVFFIDRGQPGILETTAYQTRRLSPQFATQSGPMLVINGRLHPAFNAVSSNTKIRNGVGVEGTRVVFAVSEHPVTFHAFATLFRDVLKTPDALFLDGSISRLYAPALGRDDFGAAMGPIVGVTVPAPPVSRKN
jgi:uncharacterized protein YigE (DUF2233 family)